MARFVVPQPPGSEITSEAVWRGRREWIKQAAAGSLLAGTGAGIFARSALAAGQPLPSTPNPAYQLDERQTSFEDVTGYNNFYEFGTDKEDPKRYAGKMQVRPWTVRIEGEVHQAKTFDIDDLLKLAPMEERVYRLRCVEGWSMVIPWNGYSLSALLKQVEPTANAKYVEFVTATQPENMPGMKSRIIPWPYVEGLRLDEAMHPLTMLVFGVYGQVLPNQNGAPLRLAVPWKYGFKSGKSITTIRFVEKQPVPSWVRIQPSEYGFYANVNPSVPHPRWSQATERRIGDSIFAPRVDTRLFNGYAEQVASLYSGMDLRRNY